MSVRAAVLFVLERGLSGPALADPSRHGASSALSPTVPAPSPSDEDADSEALPRSTDTSPEAGL